MAKEWILNSAMNRFQFNFKRNIGPTAGERKEIRNKDVIDDIQKEIERLKK